MGINFVENIEKMTDAYIVNQIKDGNYELLNVIIERYNPVIFYYINKFCPENYREDAVQEATLALYSAVKDYDAKKSSFSTFATLCIKRAVISILRGSQRKKDIPDELLISLENEEIADNNSPEDIFIEQENYRSLADTIKLELSSLEFEVLQLYLSGERYSEIADKLSISEKSVNNALSRIRKKLKSN